MGWETEELTQRITIRRLGKLREISFDQAPVTSAGVYTLANKDKPNIIKSSGYLYGYAIYESSDNPHKYYSGYIQFYPQSNIIYGKYISATNGVITPSSGAVYSTFAYMTD